MSTVIQSLAPYAPLASPTFTGVPAAPTAAVSTNTTQLATTAFVMAQPPSVTNAVTGIMFTVAKTSVNLKAAGTTDIFTVPVGVTYVCVRGVAVITAVTGAGAGTQTFKIVESGAATAMVPNSVSTSQTAQVGWVYSQPGTAALSPTLHCVAGNKVQVVVSTSHAGSTSVTGTVWVTGFYY